MTLLDDFKPGVLYIEFSDKKRLEFSSEKVRTFATEYLDAPEHVPDHVRKAVDFQRCSVCPYTHQEGYCHALFPSLTFFDVIEKYSSYEQVQVFYLDPMSNCLLTQKVGLQNALQYVSILSLINYCELGQQYRDYFYMVTPLMKVSDIASRIYLNAFWLLDGNKERVKEHLKEFSDKLSVTINCQVKRLRLISKSDAILNAFVITHVLTDMLQIELVESVKEGFKKYNHKFM